MPTYGRRRAYGQHFLRDEGIARAIAQAALSEAKRLGCKTLLEIGPGKGAITQPILNEISGSGVNKFILCEKDQRLVDEWRTILSQTDLTVETFLESADFLELPKARYLSLPPVAVASNLPYSSGTAIFTLLAAETAHIPVMVLMFQAEVARRLYAEPDSREWGRLSVWTQNQWDVKKLLSVSRKAFTPPPDVESEVVVVTRRALPRIPAAVSGPNAALWEPLLKACFAHRRKMLRSGLPETGPFRDALNRSMIDSTKRAEALTWDEWALLFHSL